MTGTRDLKKIGYELLEKLDAAMVEASGGKIGYAVYLHNYMNRKIAEKGSEDWLYSKDLCETILSDPKVGAIHKTLMDLTAQYEAEGVEAARVFTEGGVWFLLSQRG